MLLSEKQQRGLNIVLKRYEQGKRYSVISGYAGSGKSTLVKFIVEALGFREDQDEVAFATPTGKAAQVLNKMGHQSATTIHRVLYKWVPTKYGTFVRKRIDDLPPVVIVDEVSMIPKEFITELLSHKESYIIFCGDPFQIPPINPETAHNLLDNPHVFLDEVHRQALDSNIIKLSMNIRNLAPLTTLKTNDVQIVNRNEGCLGMYLWADQIICATNKTREKVNKEVLAAKGFTKGVEEDMKIICLKNEWNILSDKGNPIVNGTIGIISNIRETTIEFPETFGIKPYPGVIVDLTTETGDIYKNLAFDKQEIITGKRYPISLKTQYAINRYYQRAAAREEGLVNPTPLSANYGYAITGHRAQGSQWEKVVLIEEFFPTDRIEHARWVYTGITRPSQKLVVLKK